MFRTLFSFSKKKFVLYYPNIKYKNKITKNNVGLIVPLQTIINKIKINRQPQPPFCSLFITFQLP